MERLKDYTYRLFKEMKLYLRYNSLNKLIIELVEIWYLEKEKIIRKRILLSVH